MQRFILALTAIASLFIVSGCGQSGPLYLPGNPSRIEQVPPAPTGAEQEQEQEKAKEKGDTSST